MSCGDGFKGAVTSRGDGFKGAVTSRGDVINGAVTPRGGVIIREGDDGIREAGEVLSGAIYRTTFEIVRQHKMSFSVVVVVAR